MRNDPINNLLLLALWHVVDVTSLMQLGLTSIVTFLAVEKLIYTDGFLTARILVLRAKRRRRHLDLCRLLMEATVAHFSYWIVLCAPLTLNEVQVGPDLPIDLFPTDSVGFTDEGDELL